MPTKEEVIKKMEFIELQIKELSESPIWEDDASSRDKMIEGYREMLRKGEIWLKQNS